VWWESAGVLLRASELLHDGASLKRAERTIIGTRADDLLQDRHVPPIHEVTVEAAAIGITIREDEGLHAAIPLVGELVGIVEDLEEQAHELDWMGGWAWTVVVGAAGWVGHVTLVVRAVQVHTIPAGREEDLCS
jgi:hypothetical protein